MYPQQSQRTALDFNSLLITIEERADAALLDAARALLDGLTLEETVDSLGTLLDWQLVPEGAAAARRERCRLVSYAAIMHGSALLPHLPAIARLIVPLLGEPEEVVAEELQRTVGNLSRYVLATHSDGPRQPADVLGSLLSPLLAGAASGSARSARGRACFSAIHRALTELPHELLRPETILPTSQALVQLIATMPEPPPGEALPPLTKAAHLAGVHLTKNDFHQHVQIAIASLRADTAINRRGGVELLRTLAPMLRAREGEVFAAELRAWVADEIGLLPEPERRQLVVQDLAAAYAAVGANAAAVPYGRRKKEAREVEAAAEAAVAAAEETSRLADRALGLPPSSPPLCCAAAPSSSSAATAESLQRAGAAVNDLVHAIARSHSPPPPPFHRLRRLRRNRTSRSSSVWSFSSRSSNSSIRGRFTSL